MKRIKQVEVLESYRLELVFDDGLRGIVDLSSLVGKGVFAAWLDPKNFQNVVIGPNGELTWGEEIDLCPDALYLEATGQQPADLFPVLKREDIHA